MEHYQDHLRHEYLGDSVPLVWALFDDPVSRSLGSYSDFLQISPQAFFRGRFFSGLRNRLAVVARLARLRSSVQYFMNFSMFVVELFRVLSLVVVNISNRARFPWHYSPHRLCVMFSTGG